jgi:ribokinase
MTRFWVIGPIAWDWTFEVDRVPESGGFVQARSARGRPGGTGANVAVGLASAGEDVRMIGYVGRDGPGKRLLDFLRDHRVDTTHIQELDAHTSQVLLFVEPDGERTIIGIHRDEISSVAVPANDIRTGDVVYFAKWHELFVQPMTQLMAKDVIVATVPPEPGWSRLPAMYVIGSESHHRATPNIAREYEALLAAGSLRCVVVTRGSYGAVAYVDGHQLQQPARIVTPVDETGAGDAFVAGFLHELARGSSVEDSLRVGTDWGTAAVLVRGSIPPPWSAIAPGGPHASPPPPERR